GRALSRQGIHAAVVSPDGSILGANQAFALRAVGDENQGVVGADFVSFLRSDEHERILYARDGRAGTPVRLLHVPLVDPDLPHEPDPARTCSLMLLVDSEGGAGDLRAGIPQIEALLSRLPLGLAMTDRDGRFLFANEAFLRAAGHSE